MRDRFSIIDAIRHEEIFAPPQLSIAAAREHRIMRRDAIDDRISR
jgi:hypothetical protein